MLGVNGYFLVILQQIINLCQYEKVIYCRYGLFGAECLQQ
jgi:hypothetical protein